MVKVNETTFDVEFIKVIMSLFLIFMFCLILSFGTSRRKMQLTSKPVIKFCNEFGTPYIQLRNSKIFSCDKTGMITYALLTPIQFCTRANFTQFLTAVSSVCLRWWRTSILRYFSRGLVWGQPFYRSEDERHANSRISYLEHKWKGNNFYHYSKFLNIQPFFFLLFSALLFGGQLERAPGPNRSKYIGCIDPQCDIVSVIKDAYENARFLCDQYYLSSPDLIIQEAQHNGKTPAEFETRRAQIIAAFSFLFQM